MVERTAHNGLVVGSIPTKLTQNLTNYQTIMQINFKNYKIKKTKNYIKKNNIYFFFKGPNKNAKNWILIEQNLKLINFTCYKIFNKTSKKLINQSVYRNIKEAINGITFLIKPNFSKISKEILITNFESLLFNVLVIKLNNKIYQKTQIEKNYSLNYRNTKKLLFQFKLTSLKKSK